MPKKAPQKPLTEPKKTKKAPSTKKPKKTSKLTHKENELLSLLEAVDDQIKMNNKMMIVYSSSSPDFKGFYYVIAKLINLEVLRVNNNSAFQPYETRENKDYCALYILQIGEGFGEGEGVIRELKKLGCPHYAISSLYAMQHVFGKLD